MKSPKAAQRQARRLTAFEAFLHIRERMRSKSPTSVIRLGDGEGALLGYPTITNRQDVDRFLLIWLRTKAIPEEEVLALASALKQAVSNADIIGLPREKQIREGFHPWRAVQKSADALRLPIRVPPMPRNLWRAVQESVDALGLISPSTLETHTALHRLLQHALLYRPILQDSAFLGIISCRPIAESLQQLFNIDQVRWHGVQGELDATGPVETAHYPDGFRELRRTLTVPFSRRGVPRWRRPLRQGVLPMDQGAWRHRHRHRFHLRLLGQPRTGRQASPQPRCVSRDSKHQEACCNRSIQQPCRRVRAGCAARGRSRKLRSVASRGLVRVDEEAAIPP